MGILSKLTQAISSKPRVVKQREEDPEIVSLREQLAHGKLEGVRGYLGRTRETRDWEDRIYVLNKVVEQLPRQALHFGVEQEPGAADLALIYTAYYADLAGKRRGKGTCDEIEEAQVIGAAEAIRAAIPGVQAAIKLDPTDPTGRAIVLGPLTIFGELRPLQKQFFEQIVELAPDLPYVYSRMAHSLSKRWHGSHEESLAVARQGLAKATSGSDAAGALFQAHDLVRGHLEYFDKDVRAAAKYIQNPEVVRELTEAFDSWTGPAYVPKRSSIGYLQSARKWFWAFNDRERTQKAESLIETVRIGVESSEVEEHPHSVGGTPDLKSTDQAKKCLDLISFGANELRDKQAPKALQAFLTAAKEVKFYQLDGSVESLVHIHIALAGAKLGNQDGSRNALEYGLKILDQADFSSAPVRLVRLMAAALEELDAIRAVKFLEILIDSGEESRDPLKLAALLRRLGNCYSRAGLRDHAVIPLRAAVKIYRSSPADPGLPVVLLNLGNALRTSVPAEAEALYRESAGLYEAQMNLVSAAPAWVNLGILCSEQGRYDEALELYRKVLNLREKTPNTPPARIAGVLNNMAGVYREMKRFDEAHAAIDRAIRLIKPEEPTIPSYYETRGHILLDEGHAERSLEWIGKAISIREKQSSPDRDALVKNYEVEIEALEKLGRHEEAEQTRNKLAELRAFMQSAPKSEAGLSGAPELTEGAVFVELPFGKLSMTPKLREQIADLARALSAKVREGLYGRFSSSVTIPEQVTLIFYGSNAELLYKVIEPVLAAEKICAGARVLIQQNGTVREQMVSVPRSFVN